ncbi:hypothetical protein BASA61_009722, partial [Batrachochytrium salamandrivorans]
MKFNALVVAAMVITSVNAGGRGGFKSFLDKVGRMMRSGSSYGTLKNDLETEPSQNPPVNEPRPRPPRNSPRYGTILGPPQNPQVRVSEPVTILKRLLYALGEIQKSRFHKKTPECIPIVEKFTLSWKKMDTFDGVFHRQVPDLYEILRKERHKEFNNLIKLIELTEGEFEKIEDDEDKVEDDEGADDGLIAEKVHIWMGSNLGAISDLESIKAEYDSLEEEYRESWKVLNDNNCMAELFKYLSPDHM